MSAGLLILLHRTKKRAINGKLLWEGKMRSFHVSEESNIQIFEPRIPVRDDMDKKEGR